MISIDDPQIISLQALIAREKSLMEESKNRINEYRIKIIELLAGPSLTNDTVGYEEYYNELARIAKLEGYDFSTVSVRYAAQCWYNGVGTAMCHHTGMTGGGILKVKIPKDEFKRVTGLEF
jgi:hypothetical protein